MNKHTLDLGPLLSLRGDLNLGEETEKYLSVRDAARVKSPIWPTESEWFLVRTSNLFTKVKSNT